MSEERKLNNENNRTTRSHHPNHIGLALLAAAVVFIGVTGQWTHPLSIIGYILGGLILLVALAVFVGWKLPFIANDQQALLAIAILASLKVVNAVTHYLLSRS